MRIALLDVNFLVHLLGLAVRNHGKLVTFDKSIPLNALRGASAGHLVLP